MSSRYKFLIGNTDNGKIRLPKEGDQTAGSDVVLDDDTGNEIAWDFRYTVDKDAGNDTGFKITKTDTASPGTSTMFELEGAFAVDDNGTVRIADSVLTVDGNFRLQAISATEPAIVFDAASGGGSNVAYMSWDRTATQYQFTVNGTNELTIHPTNGATFYRRVNVADLRCTSDYTVASLAAQYPSPLVGQIARITDGDAALAWGATAVNSGAGATPYLVWYNGSNWTVMGK